MATKIEDGLIEMKVGKSANVYNLAMSISRQVQQGNRVRLVAIGANAVNQAVKAAAKANTYIAPKYAHWKIFFIDRPEDVNKDNELESITAMVFETYFEGSGAAA